MKLLVDIHGYPPSHNAGAEWMAHHMFRYLAKFHDVHVVYGVEDYELDGVFVYKDANLSEHYQWADVVFTHLDKTGRVYNYCKQYNKPMVHIIHNTYKNVVAENMGNVRQYAIYNTEWVRDDRKNNHKIIDSIIVHPPIFTEDYKIQHLPGPRMGDYITLINVNEIKGGDIFNNIAKEMPDRMFLGVLGDYGQQLIANKQKNIHYMPNNPDITNKVYRRTRLLLMPSRYESYGRTAIEACCSGIPVICSRTPGLMESLKYAGNFVSDRTNVREWVSNIKWLDDPVRYEEASQRGLKRSAEIAKESLRELEALNEFLKKKFMKIVVIKPFATQYGLSLHRRGEILDVSTPGNLRWATEKVKQGFAQYMDEDPKGDVVVQKEEKSVYLTKEEKEIPATKKPENNGSVKKRGRPRKRL